MRKNLNPVDINQSVQLPHPGLGRYGKQELLDLNREWDDEEKRTVGGDISPRAFATHQFIQMRYIPCTDSRIAQFEERPILLPRKKVDDDISLDEFGKPCPECKQVIVVSGDGCAHCIPSSEIVPERNFVSAIDKIDFDARRPRKGKKKTASPHLTKDKWKPPFSALEKFNFSMKKLCNMRPEKRAKFVSGEIGRHKVRKNTPKKIATLLERRVLRKEKENFVFSLACMPW